MLISENIYVQEKKIFEHLEKLHIPFELYRHKPVFTCEEAEDVKAEMPSCGHAKNLFLKDTKNNLWLITALQETKIDLKEIGNQYAQSRFSFCKPEQLLSVLAVEPGSVTPCALINRPQDVPISVILDKKLFEHKQIGIHPLHNAATILISPVDLERLCQESATFVQVAIF